MREFTDDAILIDTNSGPRPPRLSKFAIGSLIFGVLSIVLSVLGLIITFVLGFIAIATINSSEGREKGKGLAIAGMILSVVFSLTSLSAAWYVRAVARITVSQNNMQQIVIAGLNYESAFMELPNDILDQETRQPLLSWRVSILPHMGYEKLYDQFNTQEPWDSPTNLEAAKSMPPEFRHPAANIDPTYTVYQHPVGNGAAYPKHDPKIKQRLRVIDFRNGTSNVIILVETSPEAAVPWTKPADYLYDPKDPKANLGSSPFGWLLFACTDGSSQKFKKNMITKGELREMFAKDGLPASGQN